MLYRRVSPITRPCWSRSRSRLESTVCMNPFMFQETIRRPRGPSQGRAEVGGPKCGGGGAEGGEGGGGEGLTAGLST
jgi:hypothetical protein